LSGPVHAGLIALPTAHGWSGVLIEGPSGSGKSDLALRALDHGFRLVADDRVLLWVSGGALFGRAPDVLSGLIEMRGLGVEPAPALRLSRIALVVECVAAAQVERLPDPLRVERQGVLIPVLRLWPFEPGAPAKLRHTIAYLGHGD
jgi:serine kinase of HPr protein (carbohydrate metabolism regulator)